MTYAHFLILFLLVPICALALLLRSRLRRGHVLATAAMAAVAVAYTAPWDNLIVALGVWSYDPARVWGVALGVVPLEEYLFFVLQTVLTSLLLLSLAPPRHRPGQPTSSGPAVAVAAPLLVSPGLHAGAYTYLVLELAWALPVIVLQWAVGHEVLRARLRPLVATVAVSTLYLAGADGLAIREGIWGLSPTLTLGVAPAGIPLEEALFFLLSNTMLVQGLLLAAEPAAALVRLRTWWRVLGGSARAGQR